MKKYFGFLSIATIIVFVASISVLGPLAVKAVTLTNIQVSLSSYDVSATGTEVYVDMTANVTLDTTLSGTDGDKVVITFPDIDAAMEDQFWIEDANLNDIGDVILTCDPESAADLIEVASVASADGGGTVPGTITITTGDGGDEATCAATNVLKIEVKSTTGDGDELRTPYTANDVSPKGYRIKFETMSGVDVDDTGIAAVYINEVGDNQIQIYGTVDPVLSLALSTNSCDLGVLTKDAYRTCGYLVTVGTNADLGYGAYIQSNGDLQDPVSLATIQREADSDAPTYGNNGQIDKIALLPQTEYGVAIDTTDTADYADFTGAYGACDDIEGDTNPLDYDVPVDSLDSDTAQLFAHSDDPVDASTNGKTTVCHVARISGAQPSGNFEQIVTITVVGNF